jgi:carboxylesterase
LSLPLKRLLVTALGALALLLLAVLAAALLPVARAPFALHTEPVADYAAARSRATELLASPPAGVRPECLSTILDHGRRTRDAFVLLHGYTNCPAQFRAFAEQLFQRGANILVLRLPHHGLADRMTSEPAQLTAQAMLDSANLAVDLARGFGERVIVVGLSINAVTAAWLAQERGDIALAVVIAPFLAPVGLPDGAIQPLANLLSRAPNAFLWWDPQQKENLAGSKVSYPRYATRPLGEVMQLGLDVFARAKSAPPRTPRILLVTSPADAAISLPRVQALAALWGGHAKSRAFPAEWNIPHDCIDPAQPGADTARVYPQLVQWLDEALP